MCAMGGCLSTASVEPPKILEHADGTDEEYQERFVEDCILGEGQYGVVKLVHYAWPAGKEQASPPLACKMLHKGAYVRNDVQYSPLSPKLLRSEVNILQTLAGGCFCLKLMAVYESPRVLYVVTEYCSGGGMMEYVASRQQELRTEDVSRIAFQLLSAVDHCARNGVIHRDIKPDNIMFQDASPSSELRLIDFGCGCIDPVDVISQNNTTGEDESIRHTTYAGSPFYNSPELFQRNYTCKTDVWSVGVTLYVLVAGYPADNLQRAFNVLHCSNSIHRDLRRLPNLPDNLPESCYNLLNKLLVYRHKVRPLAGDMLHNEFVQFHQLLCSDASGGQQDTAGVQNDVIRSLALPGSVGRHGAFLDFKKFERSLTTLLATMLTSDELSRLLSILKEYIEEKLPLLKDQPRRVINEILTENSSLHGGNANVASGNTSLSPDNPVSSKKQHSDQKLLVVLVSELRKILETEFPNQNILETLDTFPNASAYGNFAYHVALLYEFACHEPGFQRVERKSQRSKQVSMPAMFAKMGRLGILSDSHGTTNSKGSNRSFNDRSLRRPMIHDN